MTDRPDTPASLDLTRIAHGFSNMAAEYDALAATHPIVIWMRDRIRTLVEAQVGPGAAILEINAGSGLDAYYLAAKGYRVHATDVAPGMLEALAAKAAQPYAGGRLSYERLSNTDLDRVAGGPYDLVLSNLGGLNCIDDLSLVTRHFPAVLKPGGAVVLVVMPPVCPWELTQALRGHLHTATRRLKRDGTLANVGGASVHTWYYPPARLQQALGPRFEAVALRSYCCFAPPSFFAGFARRHENLTSTLMRIDDRLGAWWPFRGIGDFYALVARLKDDGATERGDDSAASESTGSGDQD